jgi:uncharacterized protein involved in outer membrane biogenesis
MRWLKYLFITLAGLIIFCATLLVTFVLLLDDNHYREVLVTVVNRATDHHLEINGPLEIKFSKSPSFTVSDIHFETANKEFELSSAEIHLQVDILPLLTKHLVVREFLARDSIINVRQQPDESEGEDTAIKLNPPVIENFRIENLAVNYLQQNETEPLQLNLDSLKIDDKDDTGPVVLTGTGTIEGRAFHLDGEFGAIATLLGSDQPYPLKYRSEFMGFVVQAEGTISHPHGDGELDLEVRQQAPDVQRVLELLHVSTPEIGSLMATYRLTGTFSAPQLVDLDLSVSKDDVALQLSGEVGDLLALKNFNLDFSAQTADKTLIAWLLPEESPVIHRIKTSGKLSGSADAIALGEFTVDASGPGGQRLKITGSTRIVEDPQPLRDLKATLSVSSADTAFARKYLKTLPLLGPVAGTARVSTNADALVLEDIKLTVGNTKTEQIEVQGSIRHLVFTPAVDVSKMDLKLNLNATSAKAIGKLINSDLPDIGPVKLNAQYSGSLSRSNINNLQLQAGSPNQLQIDATGDIGLAPLNSDNPLAGLELDVNVQAPSTASLTTITGTGIPALGSLNGTAHVSDAEGVIAIKSLDINVTRGTDFQYSLKGSVANLGKRDGLDITFELSASDLNELGQPFGHTLPKEGQVTMSGSVKGSLETFHYTAHTNLRNTTINADLTGTLTGDRPRLAGSITIPDLDVLDIGLYPEQQTTKTGAAPQRDNGKHASGQAVRTEPLFSKKPFDLSGLNAIDLDLDLKVNKVSSVAASLQNIYSRVLLKEGRLELTPLKYTVDGDVITHDVTINASTRPPTVSLFGSGEDINLGLLLANPVTKKSPIRGIMSARAELKSRGQSPAELAANLDGTVLVVTENAKASKSDLNLASSNVLGWMISNILTPNQDINIGCAIFSMHFHKGIGDTDIFMMDTPDLMIRGDADINFVNETLDVAILSERKVRLFRTAKPMKIYGPIANPKYELVSVADLTQEASRAVLLAPLTITTGVLRNLVDLVIKPGEAQPGSCDKFLK